jgi:hypothetical protein
VLQRVFRRTLFGGGRDGEGEAGEGEAEADAPLPPEPSAHALTIAHRALAIDGSGGGAQMLEAQLQKRSRSSPDSTWSRWAPRYARIGDGSLRYYKTEYDQKPQGRAYLWDLTAVVAGPPQPTARAIEADGDDGGWADAHPFGPSFLVRVRGGKEFEFACEDAQRVAVWVAVLQAIVFVNRTTAPAPTAAPVASESLAGPGKGGAGKNSGSASTTGKPGAATTATATSASADRDSDLD